MSDDAERPDGLATPLQLGAARRAWLRAEACQRPDRSMSAIVRELVDKERERQRAANTQERIRALENLIRQLDATNLRLKQELEKDRSSKRATQRAATKKAAVMKRKEIGAESIRQVRAWRAEGRTLSEIVLLCKALDIRTPEGRRPYLKTLLKWIGEENIMSDDIDRKAEAHRVRNRRHYRRHRKKILDRQQADYQESVSYYKPHLSASEKQRREKRNTRRRQRYAENRERILEERRANYCAISAREYYEANRCKIKERAKRYYKANRERMKAQSLERYHRLKAERDAQT